MKFGLTYGPMCLTHRGTLEFAGHRQDPRGLTGSEIGFVRICQELVALGHDVTAFTQSHETEYEGLKIRPLEARNESEFDVALSINEPETLREMRAKVKGCEQWLNSFDYCAADVGSLVDVWISPSEAHRDFMLGSAHDTKMNGTGGTGTPFQPLAESWVAIPLGCDPERYDGIAEKVPGRVVYCSSPDRGLHWVLQEWPHIKRAVPHATLKIFYRLKPWLDAFKPQGRSPRLWFRPELDEYFAPTEPLLARAHYIEQALKRMSGPEWGITVCDSVCREQIEREMCEAEVLAFPVDTVRWSEGFSCTTLEACAARACPVLWDCDAIGQVYGESCDVQDRGDLKAWRVGVVRALRDSVWRSGLNESGRALAEELTWKNHVKKLVAVLTSRLPTSTSADESKTSSPNLAAASP